MFAKAAGQLDRLIDAGMTPDQVHVFRSIFGNPDMDLEHDGLVTLNGPVVISSSGGQGSLRPGGWAVAQHNWDYNPLSSVAPSKGGKTAIVVCKEATDWEGNGTSGKDDITVYLPVTPGDDPNVVAGDIIPFFEMGDGVFMAPGLGDDRIGTLRQDINGDSGIEGWGVMNGTANSTSNGGSGLDIATNSRFLRQWASSGNNKTTGGAATDSVTVATHTSGTSGSSGAHTHSTDSQGAHTHTAAAAEVAINDAHSHSVSTDNFEAYAGGTSLSGVTAVGGIDGALSAELHTHSTDSQGGHTHTAASSGAHTHTTPALSHSAVSVDIIPPFIYVGFLERLNNSRSGLGL